jgi:hypothetical protein
MCVLDPDESAAMLDSALRSAWPSDTRAVDDPEGIAELTRLCGHLPLALGIAAAMLVEDRQQSITELVDELRDASTRLHDLRYGDSLAVHAAFDLSYAPG